MVRGMKLALVLLTLFAGKRPMPASCECTANTCLNGGICDVNFIGRGFKCICPLEGMVDYGPRCELAVQGYSMSDKKALFNIYSKTIYNISSLPFEADRLVITFELSAHCFYPPCAIFAVSSRSGRPLVSVELHQEDDNRDEILHEYYIWGPATTAHNNRSDGLRIWSDKMAAKAWNQNWQTVTIIMKLANRRDLLTHVNLCSLALKQCLLVSQSQPYLGDLASEFATSVVAIGHMHGCVRFVRFNDALLDMAKYNHIEGPQAIRAHYSFCHHFQHSCLSFESQSDRLRVFRGNRCGAQSRCNGEVARRAALWSSERWNCSCQCVNARRRPRETIAGADSCGARQTNECAIDTPVINTESENYEASWTMQNMSQLSVDLSFFSLEATIRTHETNVQEVIALKNNGISLVGVRILNGFLQACVESSCYEFANISMSDSDWHSVSLSVRQRELVAALDMQPRVYLLAAALSPAAVTPTIAIPNSCIRAIRLSGIYLPTTDADATADSDAVYLKVRRSKGVWVSPTCNINTMSLPDGCNCSAFEDCSTASGKPVCSCKDGFLRTGKGSCTINPELLNEDGSRSPMLRSGRPRVAQAAPILLTVPSLLVYLQLKLIKVC